MLKKLSIQSWFVIGLTTVVIIFILKDFLKNPTNHDQDLLNYQIETLHKEIEILNIKYKQDSIANVEKEAEIQHQYQEITRINKNVNILYRKLNEDVNTVHNLNSDDSFKFFSTWLPKED